VCLDDALNRDFLTTFDCTLPQFPPRMRLPSSAGAARTKRTRASQIEHSIFFPEYPEYPESFRSVQIVLPAEESRPSGAAAWRSKLG
jgi:hypothetical protein